MGLLEIDRLVCYTEVCLIEIQNSEKNVIGLLKYQLCLIIRGGKENKAT